MLGPVELVAETGSTNQDLLERAAGGAPHGLVLVAGHQTAGRGRLDRFWEAPPDSSLLVSVLLRVGLTVNDVHIVPMAAGLAAVDAIAEVGGGLVARLKWPNDVMIGDPERKVAGLLAESVVRRDRLDAIVVGMGLNVRWPTPMPGPLARSATSLNHHVGDGVTRDAVLAGWLRALERHLDRPEGVIDAYRSVCSTIGRTIRVDLGDGTLTGRAVDVDRSGRLLVDDGSQRHVVSAGDVVHLRVADTGPPAGRP